MAVGELVAPREILEGMRWWKRIEKYLTEESLREVKPLRDSLDDDYTQKLHCVMIAENIALSL